MQKKEAAPDFLGGVKRLLAVICNLVLLNWLFFLCAIPIVTIGPALCALFAVTLRMVRDEHTQVFRGFFQAFRENLKRGILFGLIGLAAGVVTGTDLYYALQQGGAVGAVLILLSGVGVLLLLAYCTYIFPLEAMFRQRFSTQIRNAFLLALGAPGKTLLMWVAFALPVLFYLCMPEPVLCSMGFLYLMFAFSLPAYMASHLLRQVFDRANGSPIFTEAEMTAEEEETPDLP